MTYTEQAIRNAIKSGFISDSYSEYSGNLHGYNTAEIWIDPSFWSSLGKSLGWQEAHTPHSENTHNCQSDCDSWQGVWHDFINHLIAGKSAESFFEGLINVKG